MVATQLKELANQQKDWFLSRVGQRVFRGPNGCGCDSCKKVERWGLIIKDEEQASYLYSVQGETGITYYQK